MISIISLNWNTTDMMIRLYESLVKTTKNDFNLIIVDNGSCKEELDKLDKYFIKMQNVFIEALPENVGFAAGNNHGLGLVDILKEKYIYFINSDIIVEENEWDIKLNEILRREDVGIVGCAYHPLKWTKDGRFQIQQIPEQPIESESVQGSFFGIKTETIEELIEKGQQIFDEEFKFAHYEETDLHFRIIQLGYKCFWVPCKHIHDHHRSATKSNGFKLNKEIQNEQQFKANSEKNRRRLLEKHKDWFNSK